jgi:hemin uptake protein HemP
MKKSSSIINLEQINQYLAKPVPVPVSIRQFNSQELFSGLKELVIHHAGEQYYLRLTSKGKLILTK